MTWDVIKLNDGRYKKLHYWYGMGKAMYEYWTRTIRIGTSIPSIAFGTWTLGTGQQSTDHVDQAISVGFNHIGMYASRSSVSLRVESVEF